MGQVQDYQVNYDISVKAEGVEKVSKLAEAVDKLKLSKNTAESTIANLQAMMDKMNAIFRPKGKKRDFSYKIDVNTKNTEEKLSRISSLLDDIKAKSEGIKLVINAGEKIDSKSIKAQAQAVINNQIASKQKEAEKQNKKSAADTVKALSAPLNEINKVVGKVNAALISLQTGREINIKTDVAKERLLEILSLMRQIKGASKMTLGMGMGSPGTNNTTHGIIYPPLLAAATPVVNNRQRNKIITTLNKQKREEDRDLSRRKKEQDKIWNHYEKEQEREYRKNIRDKINRFNRQSKEEQARADLYEEMKVRSELAKDKARERENRASQKAIQKESRLAEKVYGNKRRAAINRLQYSKAPSFRSLPFAGMISSYMAYGLIKSELSDAVDYANTMESARSILKVADSDLGTFEYRFDKMAKNVRQIGVETKFTAQEIAGATKFLAMAGMDINTINSAMRPITNLALIGDNDVGQIADLTTNIMSGYDIKSTSMNSVADIISSTISRSNVNVLELAESYKMAAGYLKMSGIDFSESTAAVGVLGNAGIKGTMAGTALRAMSTRFAKPTKEAQKTLDRLGIKFTEYYDSYGKQIERLRSLSDIFEELHDKGATVGDMQAIFGKIGGNAAMMFVDNYKELRTLSNQNRASNGISSELAEVKQNTTKGLWAQMTSTFSESFMQAYELLEPVIRSTLNDLLASFKPREFAQGIATIGRVLLDVFSTLGKIGSWITRNFNWIEPLLFSGFVATRVFKLAGAITNLGIAFGFLGKQAIATKAIGSITGIVGAGTNVASLTAKQATSGLFASHVSTGSGVIGAGSSIAAIGTGAVVATAAISTLVGALGFLAYKTWKVKEAKDAVQEDLDSNRRYYYPSIDALRESLSLTYKQALATKDALDDVTNGKTLSESSGQAMGNFSLTGNWWRGYLNMLGAVSGGYTPTYTTTDAYQDDVKNGILVEAQRDAQLRRESFWAKLGALRTPLEINAFIRSIKDLYGQTDETLDASLWTTGKNGERKYVDKFGDKPVGVAAKTFTYQDYMNNTVVEEFTRNAEAFRDAISSQESALHFLSDKTASGETILDLEYLKKNGYFQNSNGQWVQQTLNSKATDKEREVALSNFQNVHARISSLYSTLRNRLGSADAAETLLKKAGFDRSLYSNEPDKNDPDWNRNNISYGGGNSEDDGGAGGNYSGTGKLSSAAPRQVIVNITNLLSVQTIELMKTPEGKSPEIQDMKEMMAQALIDVVHDFDASWNG